MNPHRTLLSQHPLAQLAIAFSAGICAATYLPTTLTFSFAAGVAFTLLSSFFVVIKKRDWLAGSALLLAFFFAGQALAVLEKHAEPSSIAENAIGQLVDANRRPGWST